jgi:heme-degrading monooxygenase HmoA
MIARTWTGATRAQDADAYLRYLEATGLAAYRATPGNVGVQAFRRLVPGPDGERAEFLLVSLWRSLDDVRAFAGDDVTRAVFYPDDARYLVARDERVAHFDVVHAAGALA